MPDLVPTADFLPAIVLQPALDGSTGSNRARSGVRQISADTDVEAVGLWLAEYTGSPHTLRSYRKEAVRLLIWATRVLGKPLSSLTREDFLAYELFLANPSVEWVDPALPRRGGGHRQRRKVIEVTPHHVLQQVKVNKFVVHDRGLSTPQDIQKGQSITISYAYDKGKIAVLGPEQIIGKSIDH